MTEYITSKNCPHWNRMSPAFIGLVNACFTMIGNIPAFTITSSFRTPADQERLKKEGYDPHPESYHMTGQALDIVFKKYLNPWHFNKCELLDSIYYVSDGHWHFEPSPKAGQSRYTLPIGLSELSNTPLLILIIAVVVGFILLLQ